MKAIGYIRVSTEDQAREGVSLDNQESKIRAYADLNNFELVDVIRDEGISGKTMDRSGMNRINTMVEAGEIEAVIVYKLDRLSRKTIDILSTLDAWEKKDIAFHSITDRIDTKTAAGKFVLTILSALAQMERDLISERTVDALAHKKKSGEWLGNIPLGYRLHEGRLIKDTDEQAIIRKARLMYRPDRNGKRKSMRHIAKALNLSLGTVHKVLHHTSKQLNSMYSYSINTDSVRQPRVC